MQYRQRRFAADDPDALFEDEADVELGQLQPLLASRTRDVTDGSSKLKTSSWGTDLPQDLLIQTLLFLDAGGADLDAFHSVIRVCRSWNRSVSDNANARVQLLWKQILFCQSPEQPLGQNELSSLPQGRVDVLRNRRLLDATRPRAVWSSCAKTGIIRLLREPLLYLFICLS
jgi:hypothetical protein